MSSCAFLGFYIMKVGHCMTEQQYEKHLNIQTEGFQIGYPKSLEYHRYEPTPYKALDQLFEVYELPPNACCIDVGCGKGRVPIYMYDRFHIPVKGIEMDSKFFAAAEHNLMLYKQKIKRKDLPITFYHEIAENYEVAVEDNTFFFFNPFSVHIFRKMMRNILASYESNLRTMHFIFYYPSPEYLDVLTNEFALQQLHEIPLMNEKNRNERLLVFTMSSTI